MVDPSSKATKPVDQSVKGASDFNHGKPNITSKPYKSKTTNLVLTLCSPRQMV